MHDLVIRGGQVIDGTGTPARRADIAIDNGIITEVGDVKASGREEIDAAGALVAPGFVDIHTHYDGQVIWDPDISPSSWHGVTTIVMGNCGVGFAPVRPDRHDFLISVMEGVEDIPGAALSEGVTFDWETFPEYLDAVEALPHSIDIGAQMPHSALRVYVMGDRGRDHDEVATDEEIAEMRRLTREALDAGALGFTTSRTINHRDRDGNQIPTLTSAPAELWGISQALTDHAAGHMEIVSDFRDLDVEFEIFEGMTEAAGSRLSVLLSQDDRAPEKWREVLDRINNARADGQDITAQIAARPITLLLGLQSSMHPFITCPTYRRELADLDLDERVERMRDPEMRATLIAEHADRTRGMSGMIAQSFHKMFPLGDPPDYEPQPETSVLGRSLEAGVEAVELAYDTLLSRDGKELMLFPLANFADGNHDALREMNLAEGTLPGLSDGGAHCGVICDASFPTYMLTHWARDRDRGERLPLEYLVQRQCRDTARQVGLEDRGTLERGMIADVNVIDFDRLKLRPPEMVHDLPAGGRRLVQRADGYIATIKSGEVIFREGEATGLHPGQLLRGPRSAAH
ncbi:MAG: amidohydrolase family protein [Actinomycetota bacterium]|uniref:Amidohydrolase 3 domain-containing protein n=1 Tax=marine metagenome TaxID=408172 RepID=A0A381NX83_9ZZZZ|nr:amidohydrolase family protein [Actinomycetota bacterium]|tara:strand:+ start:924 stop:2645 length:1722 start_codon:yes stop_codon:yes gene_type:complete